MRPKIAVWTDYRSPTTKRWKSPYRRSTRPSIGLKVLLAAVVLVAGVVGVSGIYPQVIDSEWVRNATGTHVKRPAVAEATTKRAPGPIAAVPLSPRGAAATTGDALASAPRAVPPPRAVAEPQKGPSAVAAVDVPSSEMAPLPADAQAAQVVADPPVQPEVAANPAVRPAQRYVARAPVVKKRVARVERRRSYSNSYAQYGGGWGGGGWGGYSGFGSPYHF